MHEEFKNKDGNSCIFTDDGVRIITPNCSDNIFFRYSSISEIKVNIWGVLIITSRYGKKMLRRFYRPDSEHRAQVKKLIKFAHEKMEVAQSADCGKKDRERLCLEAEQFYEKCKKAGLMLTEQSSKKVIARANQIAKENRLQIPEDQTVEMFLLGKSEKERISIDKKYMKLYKKAKRLEKLLSYHGREREIFETQAMVDYYTAQLDYVISGKALPLEKEKDWALMGGIATAIAGGAAGVAVAADLQVQNAAIRARNEQMRNDYVKISLPAYEKINGELKFWKKELNKAKNRTIVETKSEELFENITFSDSKVSILSDGSFVVQAKAVVPRVKISKERDARISGSVFAVVSQNGNVVEEIPVVIPRDRDGWKCDLIGASTSGSAKVGVDCDVAFKCRDLWAIGL